MSQRSSRVRWARTVAAVALISGGVLFGTTLPASANTNFNNSCESSEACVWDGDYNEGWLWDYEGTDTNFSNNYYSNGGPRLNDTPSLRNRNIDADNASVETRRQLVPQPAVELVAPLALCQ